MRRTLSRLPLALTIGLLATGGSPDTPTPTTLTLSADRGREIEDRDDDDDHAPVTYAVIGDVPYGTAAVAAFPTLVGAINNDPAVSRVIHVGDIKGGSDLCSDLSGMARQGVGVGTLSLGARRVVRKRGPMSGW